MKKKAARSHWSQETSAENRAVRKIAEEIGHRGKRHKNVRKRPIQPLGDIVLKMKEGGVYQTELQRRKEAHFRRVDAWIERKKTHPYKSREMAKSEGLSLEEKLAGKELPRATMPLKKEMHAKKTNRRYLGTTPLTINNKGRADARRERRGHSNERCPAKQRKKQKKITELVDRQNLLRKDGEKIVIIDFHELYGRWSALFPDQSCIYVDEYSLIVSTGGQATKFKFQHMLW